MSLLTAQSGTKQQDSDLQDVVSPDRFSRPGVFVMVGSDSAAIFTSMRSLSSSTGGLVTDDEADGGSAPSAAELH